MKKFEYKILRLKNKMTFKEDENLLYQEEQLNKLGQEGWELVEIQLMAGVAVFKKEII